MSLLAGSTSLTGGLKWLLVLSCTVWFVVEYGECGRTLQQETPSLSPAAAPPVVDGDLPLLANALGLKHLPAPIPSRANFTAGREQLEPPGSGFKNIAPMHPIADAIPSALAQPPLSPYVSDCCRQDMVWKRGSEVCHCAYPIKLDLLLLNVSLNPDWNVVFLNDLATQLVLNTTQIEIIKFYLLSLSTLNISMDITPNKGISFSANEAAKINSSLSLHKVQLDSRYVGNYSVLNITWFKAPPPSQAPTIATSPTKAPHRQAPPTSLSSTSDRGRHSNLLLILGIVTGVLFISILCVLILCLCTMRRKRKTPPTETEKTRTESTVPAVGSLPHPTSTRFIAYEELKEATNNFELASVLGEGGFGRVYKGVLNDGTAVAIKRLTSGGQQGDKEFLVEVEMLSRLHHRNLVKLVGYYSNRDSSQNLLCYELVSNGSLEAWLHAPEYAMTGHLLVKSDVYSYGVVLLELLTGRKPVDMSQPTGQENLVTWARPILRDKDRLEELADPRLGGRYPKEDFVRVCTIAAACVAPEASQRPTMGEVVQSLKMVQRITESHDPVLASSNAPPNMRQSSTTYESDGTSSMFSSGPYSGLSAFDHDNISRTAVFSEDLHEGR
ncbi:hypothetical protein ACSQ67_015342 [Phaseolus vulgaris]